MKVGVISDAHGNASALALCLDYLRGRVEKVVYLGDAVGYFPHCDAVCRALEEAASVCIMGNHEAMAMGRRNVPDHLFDVHEILRLPSQWTSLPSGWRRQVEENGPKLEIALGGRRILCVHGSPDEPLSRYVREEDAASLVFDADILLMGHTHRPFVTRNRERLVLNPGSCGLPRDCGDMLSLGVIDTESLEGRIIRIPHRPSQEEFDVIHPKVAEVLHRRCDDYVGEVVDGGVRV